MALTLKSVFKGVKKAASVANPLFGAAYDTIGGKSAKDIGKNYVQNNLDGAKVAALGATGQAALGAAGAGGAAGSTAAAAGAAGKMGTLGKIAGSPLAAGLLDFAGSTIAGIGQGKQAAEDRGEQRREYDLDYALKKQQADAAADDRQRKLAAFDANAPMRSALMQMLAQRFGINPSALPASQPPAPVAMPQPPMAKQPVGPVAPPQAPAQPDPQQLQAILARLRQAF